MGFWQGDSNTSRYVGNAPTDSADPDGADWLDDYTRWFKLHGRPGFWEGLIPIWGSGRTAYDDFQNGKPYWGTFWVVVAATDIFLVRSLATGAVKGLWKFGSHTWSATLEVGPETRVAVQWGGNQPLGGSPAMRGSARASQSGLRTSRGTSEYSRDIQIYIRRLMGEGH